MNAQHQVPIELQWLPSFSASCLHAVAATAKGHLLVDSRMAEAVAEPARALRREVVAIGPTAELWSNLLGLSSDLDSNVELASRAIAKCTAASASSGETAQRLAGRIAELESAVRSALPDLEDELALRSGPLREQWEARGPGLLKQVADWTDGRVLAENAYVILVHPCLGGGGQAQLPFNRVHIEALLANPLDELPEILRLAWMLSQLNVDLPMFSESVPAERLTLIAELAMLPVTLQAAAAVDLARMDEATLDLALRAWHISTPPEIDTVDVIGRWWGTYQETRPRWDVALAALDRMLTLAESD